MQSEDRFFSREFKEVLGELRGGVCEQELTEKLNKVTRACIETGKGGSVTLTIKVVPQGSNQAIVADNIKANVPIHSVQPTIMFVDDEGNLSRRNPKQMSLSDVVTVDKEESVRVDEKTGEVITMD